MAAPFVGLRALGYLRAPRRGGVAIVVTGKTTEPALPRTAQNVAAYIDHFTRAIVREALTVQALVDTLKGAKKFIEQAAREYAERFLFELIQNAYDAQPPGSLGRVFVLFDASEGEFGCVYVANTGTPFTADNFRAICEIAQSSKRPGEGIGNKGVGFKSVLQIAAWPEIYSCSAAGGAFDGYCFRFADHVEMRRLTESDEEAMVLADRISPYGLPVHIPPENLCEHLRRLATDGYASVIRLPLRTPAAADIVRKQISEVLSSEAPILLFLDRLAAVRVEVIEPDASRTIHELHRAERAVEIEIDGVDVVEVVLGTEARYLSLSRSLAKEAFLGAIEASIEATLLDEAWREWEGDPVVSVAVRLGDPAASDHRLYCFLPMDETALGPLDGHVNAPFAVSLARDGLVRGAPLNEFLLDAAADIIALSAIAIRAHADASMCVVDLMAWDPAHATRLDTAFKRAGRDLCIAPILPVLGEKRWSSLEAAFTWRRSMRTLTPTNIAAAGQADIVDETIGISRLDRIEALANAVIPRKMAPSLDQVAVWAEAVAVSMATAARKRAGTFDPEVWMGLYDDLAEVYGRGDSAPLRGRRLLIDDDHRIHRTWGAAGADKATAIFFPRGEIPDVDDVTRDISIPKTLGRHLAYLHADIPWRALNPVTRRPENRPGREFLDRSGLVRMPRTQSILERLATVLRETRDKQVHADALRLVYSLTTVRPYAQSPKVSELHLRVPTVGGDWRPAEEAVFSAAWPGTLGDQLERLILESTGASSDLEDLAARLLAPPDTFGFRIEPLPTWLAFLRRIGVGDGLQPIDVTPSIADQSGHWWPQFFHSVVDLPTEDHARWDPLVQQIHQRPSYPYTLYRITGRVQRLPGSGDYATFPQRAREIYGRLLVDGLANWADDVLWAEVARPRSANQADPVLFPSPAQAFLMTVDWLPVTRPGSSGEEDFAAPVAAWHYRDTDNEARPTFMPLVVTSVRRQIESSTTASDRLRKLGLNVWNDRTDSIKRLRALARAYQQVDVAETLLANFRKAYERTWTLATRGTGPEPVGTIRREDELVVTRRGRLCVQSVGADDVPYVLVDEDRLVAAILDTIEVPVLPVDPADGRAAAALIERGASVRLRAVGGADVRVFVDGVPVADREGSPLVASGREWLIDLVALTLEFKASAFNRQSDQRIRVAVETIRTMRLHVGGDVAIELRGDPVKLPSHLRRVFAVAIPGRPGVAYAGDPGRLDWDTLAMLAPKIGELIGAVETSNALESVAIALTRRLGGASFEAPTDEDYSAVFEESAERVGQVRRAQRSGITGIAFVLRPIVIALTGSDHIGNLVKLSHGEPEPEAILASLTPFADQFPDRVTPGLLVASAVAGTMLAALRDEAQVGFAELNAILVSLGEPYETFANPQGHVVSMASYLARHRDAIIDRLRVLAVWEFDCGSTPKQYAEMVRELGEAILRRTTKVGDWVRPLDPDPLWLDCYELPPDVRIAERVDAWLATYPRSAKGPDAASLPALTVVRPSNAQAMLHFVDHAATRLPVWTKKRGGVIPPAWLSDGDNLVREFTAHGLLDFRFLDETAIVTWLRRLDRWAPELPDSLSLEALGLTTEDLKAQREAADRSRWELAQARRSVPLDGRPVSLEADRVTELIAAIRDGLREELLLSSDKPLSLQVIEQRRRKAPKEPPKDRKPKERVPNRMTSDQTELIGFMGELVAYELLRKRYGPTCLWRSHYRRHLIQDGDLGTDDLGFDFEILRERRGPLMFEVKATTTDDLAFEMSETEIRVAQENSGNDRYRVLFVGNVNDSAMRWIAVLPNPLSAQGRGKYRLVGRGIRYEFDLPKKP